MLGLKMSLEMIEYMIVGRNEVLNLQMEGTEIKGAKKVKYLTAVYKNI